MPFDFLRYWRTAQDSGPIKNGRKTMQRHNSQRDKAPNWRSATKMISHALRSFHGYFMPHSRCFSTFALRFLYNLSFFLSLSRLFFSLSRDQPLVDIGICRCRVMKYSRPFSLLFFHRLPLHRCPYFATSSSCFILFRLRREGKLRVLSKDRPSWPPRTWCFHLWEMLERGHSTMGASVDDLRIHGIRVM